MKRLKQVQEQRGSNRLPIQSPTNSPSGPPGREMVWVISMLSSRRGCSATCGRPGGLRGLRPLGRITQLHHEVSGWGRASAAYYRARLPDGLAAARTAAAKALQDAKAGPDPRAARIKRHQEARGTLSHLVEFYMAHVARAQTPCTLVKTRRHLGFYRKRLHGRSIRSIATADAARRLDEQAGRDDGQERRGRLESRAFRAVGVVRLGHEERPCWLQPSDGHRQE